MKIKQTIGLLAVGVGLVGFAAQAQTTPVGAATSTTYPQGAIAPDSTPAKTSRGQKRAMRRNQNARSNSGTSTSTQDARYRQSSSSDGTSINNSNVTNYNSNNVTTAPTGAGSNPTPPTSKPTKTSKP